MPNQISQELLAQLYSQDSSDPFLALLTITHPSRVIRLVNNSSDIISRGQAYSAYPFKIILPTDDGENQRQVSLTLDNTSLELIEFFRGVTEEMPAKVEMILASLPDEVQMDLSDLLIKGIQYDKNTIVATLALDNFLNTEMTSEKYTPARFPGLF